MITFLNGGRLVTSVEELPDLRHAERLYADFETTSGDPKKKSTNPWHTCWPAGVAVTADKHIGAWYIPTGHHYGVNLPLEAVINWWSEIVETAQRWVNHNIKYDAHVSTNCWGVLPEMTLRCTLTRAKIIDSDRLKYGLDDLSEAWLKEKISACYERMLPYLHNNKDYGAIPPDIMAEYACQDVITNRRLDRYIDGNLPEECQHVANVEEKLTSVLFKIERNGLRINPTQLKIKELQIYQEMSKLDEELHELTGRYFRPHVSEDVFDVLCNQYGLPVLAWNDPDEDGDRNPSFDKHAMVQYENHPFAPKDVVKKISRYRKINTINNFFVKRYQELNVVSYLHSAYNQAVRTFRLSCKDPNAQQLNAEAKELILPDEGHSFISIDYSQIEFRFIVHYIKDRAAIEAYNENPDTDFHTWVAEMVEIHRKPAKTVNFLMGFGGGKERLLGALEGNMELMASLKDKIDEEIKAGRIAPERAQEAFKILSRARASDVYEKYHGTLPGIKRTSRDVANVARARGYIKNLSGRRRHLPATRCHIGFNAINQSGAADMLKERMVYLDEVITGTPITMKASVHDEVLFQAPTEIARDPRTIRDLIGIMESPLIPLRVPVRCAYGISEKNWKEASKGPPEPAPLIYDKRECEELRWLK